ncbi:MAG TPA: endonuclease [Flavobacterium sp.]|jgi:endonuclease I
MMKNTIFALVLLCTNLMVGQVVINELDTDTPSTDDKEFIELKSVAPNYPLDGYVLVMYNGSTTSSGANRSYYTIGLDGYITDVNGLLLIGNDLVSPVPEEYFPTSILQNGADAIALYQGSSSDFPDFTLATSANIIDGLAYDTSDADATELMALLGLTVQINENENNLGTTQSIQRKPDGTYEVKTPTPGANNDGSGVIFNGITIGTTPLTLNEGQSFTLTFTTQTSVTSDLNFSVTLNNGTFNASDYSGNLTIFIPAGSNTYSTTITVIDDAADEGDEVIRIRFNTLPSGYNRLNDNILIQTIDNDFTVAPWGTPLNPTYDIVAPTTPVGYYDSLVGLSGAALKQALQNIIADPSVVRAHTYGDVTEILYTADQNPANSNQVWLMYVEQGRAKYKFQTTASNIGSWNREHIFPQSRGGFADGTSDDVDGIDVWLPTNADDIMAGHSDAHHIRAEDGPENSLRSNRDYGSDYNGPAGNQGSWKGDVSRSAFYMAVRYNALNLVTGNPPDTTIGQLGDLTSFLAWNQTDPADDFEMNRNNIIYTWQMNRNPFIDHPELADYIWGANVGQPWNPSLSTDGFATVNVAVYPNPATNFISVSGIDGDGILELFTIAGAKILEQSFSGNARIDLNAASGIYLARITSDQQSITRKLVIQ